jgi:hypothetical protein
VAAAVAVAAAVSAAWWLPVALRPLRFFGVRRVVVTGARYLAADDVVRAMGLGEQASVFDDLDRLASRIRAMGGVEDVSVRRTLPGTLRVRVRETEPVALAEGPEGMVALGPDARALPFDVTVAPVDVPVVPRADRRLLGALAAVQGADLGLFALVGAARMRDAEVVLEVGGARVRLGLPVEAGVVRAVAAVQRDLASRGVAWRELDGRFRGWVVVRKAAADAAAGAA